MLPSSGTTKSLQRNEVTALINTLHKFSESIHIIELMRARRNKLMGVDGVAVGKAGAGAASDGSSGVSQAPAITPVAYAALFVALLAGAYVIARFR